MIESAHPLRAYRDSQGLTLEELALKLDCTAATLSRYELRQRMPRGERLRKIMAVTGISLGALMGLGEVVE